MGKKPELEEFIRDAKRAGKSHSDIEAVLLQAGWEKAVIHASLQQFSDIAFPVAVPTPVPYASPRYFFAHLFYFLLIYISVFNFLDMAYSIIDYLMPDPMEKNRYNYEAKWVMSSIRYNFSALIVSLPLLYFVNRKINRHLHASKMALPRIRILLIHFTLWLGAMGLLCSSIYLLSKLLSGAFPLPLLLKMALAGVALMVFYRYYRDELKEEE